MIESKVFRDKDGKFQFSVKGEFFKSLPNPETLGVYDLLTTHKLNSFLHSTTGPAITRLVDNYSEYWVDGRKVSKEEGERIAHNFDFNNRLLDEIKD